MSHELRRTDDATTAEHAVLERFGNPKAIARQLWWAAMKERIMKDRAFTVVFVLASLALIAAFVVPWATQQQKVNEAVLEQLQALAANIKPSDKPPVLENWSRLTVNVRKEAPAGPPVSGVHVGLRGRPFQDAREDLLNETTNESGKVAFGPIRPGAYVLHIDTNNMPKSYQSSATLYAGQENQMTVCIPSPSVMSDISMKLQVPDELKNSPCLMIIDLTHENIKRGDTTWSVNTPSRICIEMNGKAHLTGQPAQSPSAMCDLLNDKVFSNVQWPSVPYRITGMGLYCTTPRTNQPQADPGMPLLTPPPCVSKIAELIPDKPFEFQPRPGKTEWEIQVPSEFVTAYNKLLHEPVPLSIQLKPNMKRPSKTLPMYSSTLLVLRFLRESGSFASSPTLDDARTIVFGLDNSAYHHDSRLQLEEETPLKASLDMRHPAPPLPPLLILTGRYHLEWAAVLRHVEAGDGLVHWQEFCRFDQTTTGLKDLSFNAEANKANTWTVELPSTIADEIKKCAAASTTQPQ